MKEHCGIVIVSGTLELTAVKLLVVKIITLVRCGATWRQRLWRLFGFLGRVDDYFVPDGNSIELVWILCDALVGIRQKLHLLNLIIYLFLAITLLVAGVTIIDYYLIDLE